MQILKRTPLIDGHNDLPWALRQGFGNDPHGVDLNANLSTSTRLHTDIPRLRAGGVGGQFWSVYVPASMAPVDAAKATFEQIDTVKRIVAAHPETFEIATTADDNDSSCGGHDDDDRGCVRQPPDDSRGRSARP